MRNLCRDQNESNALADAILNQTTGQEMDVHGTGGNIVFVAAAPAETTQVEESEQYLPAKYNQNSTLTAELESGTNDDVNFDLELEAGAAQAEK